MERRASTGSALTDMIYIPRKLLDDTENIAFFHDDQVFAFNRNFRTRPFAEQNLVA
ncbi:hypothetical protein MNBD_ALPHA04-292, partial [hydrothermal vent metagenome]